MDRFNTIAVNTDDCDVAPEVILDALQDVISDVEAFLSDLFHRLDHNIAVSDTVAEPDERLRQRIEEFQYEKSQWEAKRKCDAEQFREKADQLTDAWLRLEAEQRKILQMKEPHAAASRERLPASDSAHRDSVGVATAVSAGSDAVAAEPVLGGDQYAIDQQPVKHSPVSHVSRSREAAVRQFQRLRREIASSRPNTGQL